jgi:uncharacterized membrane protein YgcG
MVEYRMKLLLKIAVGGCLLLGMAQWMQAQTPVPPPAPVYQPLSASQLDELVGPVALYPDPLLAVILPAATLPTQIVLADRYVNGQGDGGPIEQQPWDPSVQALAHYPAVLKWMDDNLNWTTQLGQAFLYQEPDVMQSIQRLRTSAYNLGNLQSTPSEQVINDGGYIEIVPVDPQILYVPVYQPDQVFYVAANGAPDITYGGGWPIGPWLVGDVDWGHHDIFFWNHNHPRPANWWHEPAARRSTGFTSVWRPENNRDAGVVNRGDRGWVQPQGQAVVATVGRSVSDAARPRATPMPAAREEAPAVREEPSAARTASAPVERYQRPADNVTFTGSQSTRDTQAYSARGQQSLQTTRSEPAARPAASFSGGGHEVSGGGGGSHGGGGGGGGGGGSKR